MTEPEIKAWLGFPADLGRTLRPEIVAGMANVPCPPSGPTDEHIAVFSAFLACIGPRDANAGLRLFEPEGTLCATCGAVAPAGHQCPGPVIAWRGRGTT